MNRDLKTFGIALAMMIALLPSGAMAKKAYLCIPDAITGFHYDKQTDRWRPGALEGQNPSKFILRTITDGDRSGEYALLLMDPINDTKPGWVFHEFGKDVPIATCVAKFPTELTEPSLPLRQVATFECTSNLLIDSFSHRFQLYLPGGYIDQPYFEQQIPTPEQRSKRQLLHHDPVTSPFDVTVQIGKCEAFKWPG